MAKRRTLRRRVKSKKTLRKRKQRRQRGGDGSAAIPEDYPGMLVTAKPTTDELDDPDAVPTVMRESAFQGQVDAEGKSDV
jgi:hypothetical protein